MFVYTSQSTPSVSATLELVTEFMAQASLVSEINQSLGEKPVTDVQPEPTSRLIPEIGR